MPSQSTQEARRRAHRPQLPPDPPKRPGAVEVTREALRALPPPPRSHTWEPLAHEAAVLMLDECLALAGRHATHARYFLGRDGRRLAAHLYLDGGLDDDTGSMLVLRSNQDRSGCLALGVCAWDRPSGVAWCYRVERYPLRLVPGILARAPASLVATLRAVRLYEEQEVGALRRMAAHEHPASTCEACVLHALERGVLSPRELPAVLASIRDRPGCAPARMRSRDLLLALCRGPAERWHRDVDAYRRLYAVRCHLTWEGLGS